MTLEDIKSTLGKEYSSIGPSETNYYVDDCGEPWPVDEFGEPWPVDEFVEPWPVDEFGVPWPVDEFGVPWPVDEFEAPWPVDKYKDLTLEDLKKIIDYYREIKGYYREEKDKYLREMKKAAEESILPEEAPKKHMWLNRMREKEGLRRLSEDKMER